MPQNAAGEQTATASLLQLYLARFIHHAVPTVAISQIQSDGQRATAVLTFFIAGLLYLLCFDVDNLGAYRIPPETGLLLPSVEEPISEPKSHENRLQVVDSSFAKWCRIARNYRLGSFFNIRLMAKVTPLPTPF